MSCCTPIPKKQDLPPPGGYKPIPYKRVPAKQLLSGYQVFAGYIVMTTVGLYLYNITYKKIKKHEIELRSLKMAIYPALLAERDREYLKQLMRNRAEEEKLMKNVAGWEVGKYFGQKIYKTVPDEVMMTPIYHDYFMHADPRDFFKRAYHKLRS